MPCILLPLFGYSWYSVWYPLDSLIVTPSFLSPVQVMPAFWPESCRRNDRGRYQAHKSWLEEPMILKMQEWNYKKSDAVFFDETWDAAQEFASAFSAKEDTTEEATTDFEFLRHFSSWFHWLHWWGDPISITWLVSSVSSVMFVSSTHMDWVA